MSGLAYWLITYAHEARFFFLWPIGTAAVFVWLYASKTKTLWRDSPKPGSVSTEGAAVLRDRSGVAFAGVIALGIIVLAFLPFYYANLTPRADGTMCAYPVPDVVLHIAIANELTHTIPPQAPHFSGHPLSYHYGMDVAVAMFANATRLNTRDLTLRFVPTLVSRAFDAQCFLLFEELASVRVFRRSRRVPGVFWRRLLLCSGIAAGRKRRLVASLL